MLVKMTDCPVCTTKAKVEGDDYGRRFRVRCQTCGNFEITSLALTAVGDDPARRSAISRYIQEAQAGNSGLLLTREIIERILAGASVLSPLEMAEHLILWLSRNQKSIGVLKNIEKNRLATILGAADPRDVDLLMEYLIEEGYVQSPDLKKQRPEVRLGLTIQGWAKADELRRGVSESKIAFMAMKYDDPTLEEMCESCFRPAVAETGFRLVLLKDKPRAGIIDNHLRAEIRSCRLLLADLTHGNLGAYWEAGFAEGLEKHVIYLCEKSVFESAGTHFDANHCQTVVWDCDDKERSAQDLKATIRATLPGEAIPADEGE